MELLLQKLKNRVQAIEESGDYFAKEVDKGFVESFVKTFKLSQDFVEPISKFLEYKKPTSLVWLSLSECTGCTESFLRNEIPGIDSLLLEFVSLDYHEVIMGAAGFHARDNLKTLKKGEYLLVVEGSVCIQDEYFATFGAEGVSGAEELAHLGKDALMIFGVGTCASFGGVQAAEPNPTNTQSIDKLIQREIINIPGCPPSDVNIVYTLMYAMIFEEAPSLDVLNRPLWAYGKTVHDSCERKAKFESGDFVQTFNDATMAQGYCLYKVGCKGPYAYNNCPKVKFNSKTSWPIQAGHGCIACSEPNFWDDFGVFETPMVKESKSFASQEGRVQYQAIEDFDTFSKTLKDNQIGVFLDSRQTKIIYNGENILETSLELNPRLFLEGLAKKSKLTGRLVENYKNYFSSLYEKNMQNSEESKLSGNLADTLILMHMLLNLEDKDNVHHFALNEAMHFPFKAVSDMDFSVKVNDKIMIDTTKGMRLVLCYVLGGLEYDGIAYGVLATLCKAIREGVMKFATSKDIKIEMLLGGDLVQNSLIVKWLLGEK